MKFLLILTSIILSSCISQNSSQYLFDKAYQQQIIGEYHKANYYYEKAISYDSTNWEIWLEYSACSRQNKRLQTAIQATWRTLELNSSFIGTWKNLGNIYMDCNEWEMSFNSFKQYEINNQNIEDVVQNYLNLGFKQMAKKDYKNAEKTILYALNLDPDNGLSEVDYGVALFMNGEKEKGKEYVQAGLDRLKKKNNRKAVLYAESVLYSIKNSETVISDFAFGESNQKIPNRFLQSPQKNPLSIPIDSIVERNIHLSHDVILKVMTPENWNEKTSVNDEYIEISLKTPDNDAMMLSPIIQQLGKLKDDGLILMLKSAGEALLKETVEENYNIESFEQNQIKGYYITLSDKAYNGNEDDYKYITHGYMLVNELPISFSILTNNSEKSYLSKYFNILLQMNY